MRFDEHFLRGALPDAIIVRAHFSEDPIFSIDSRTLMPGNIFIALPGMHVDGHDFVESALIKGAQGIIIGEHKKDLLTSLSHLLENKLVIVVPDTLKALLRCASKWRAQFSYPVVGITGSIGKTSTKEILSHILSAHGIKHIASHGNQNTKVGVSLNMLRMRAHHQLAIFEMGISKRGEMAELAKMVQPDTALITTICHSHMEHLGSINDIAAEKRDIFKYFTEESVGIINGDLPLLANTSYIHPVIKFGSKTTNPVQARKIHVTQNGIDFALKLYGKKYQIHIDRIHRGLVFNCLAAAAVAHYLNIPDEAIVRGIVNPPIIQSRFEQRMLKTGKGILIDDSCNANPESMKEALLAFQKVEVKGKKIAILGDMLELGINSGAWHGRLGRLLSKVPSLTHLILVGNHVKAIQEDAPVWLDIEIVPTWQQATKRLEEVLTPDSAVLVKGSRAIGLDNVVRQLTL